MRYWMLSVVMPMVLLTACATKPGTERLAGLEPGLSRAETIEHLGGSTTVLGEVTNRFGQTVEVIGYMPAESQSSEARAATATRTDDAADPETPARDARDGEGYWLYFFDDTLVRWGRAGDWDEMATRIYQMHLGPGDRMH